MTPNRPQPFRPLLQRGRGPSSLTQIVAANRPLPPPRPQGQLVGTPRPLPSLIQTGPQPQGLVQSSRFTGGSVPGGALSLTHPEQQPTFQEPQFTAPQAPQQPQAPQAATQPFSPLAHVLASMGLGAAPSGATAPTPSPIAPRPPGLPPPSLPGYPSAAQQAQGAANAAGYPSGDLGNNTGFATNPYQPQGTVTSLAALLAGLAQQGQRLGNVRRI